MSESIERRINKGVEEISIDGGKWYTEAAIRIAVDMFENLKSKDLIPKLERGTCEDCRFNNSQGRCPIYSMYHGYGYTTGHGVSCDTWEKKNEENRD